MLKSIIVVVCMAVGGLGGSLPNGVKRCSLSDPSLSACLTSSTQAFLSVISKGIPKLGVPSFEPLLVPDIQNDDPVLNFKFLNNKVTGLEKSVINSVKINQNKSIISLTFTNSGKMTSDYSVNGRLLILPVTGEGKSSITLVDIQYVFKFHYEVAKGNDGKTYWKIDKHKVTYTPKDVVFEFENLFNGNKQLADVLLRFANENWREIFGQLGGPAMIKITNKVVEIVTNVFSNLPIDDAFLA